MPNEQRYCGHKSTQHLYNVSSPCIDDHQFKEEEMRCLYLTRIGRPDILWSVNKLARSIATWDKACDKRLDRLISYIHHTCGYKQYCYVGNTAKQCRRGLFQDSDFRINVMEDIDSVLPNVQSSRQEASLYVFEANEAVIKMIIKGRSPTMRHVSRTHRVALDWLVDRIILDYIDTKNQFADILTKGNFTRDEWNHLLCLFNVSHFSPTFCSAAMAKRIQQESGEERVTAKSKLMMNLIARTPWFVSFSNSLSPGKRSYGKRDPWRSVVVDDRSGQLDKINFQEVADSANFAMGSDAAEFVKRVNDQVRNRQKNFKRCRRRRTTFYYLGSVYGCNDEFSDTHGQNFQDNQNSIVNTTDFTLKKMFHISAKLVGEQDEISNVDTIH